MSADERGVVSADERGVMSAERTAMELAWQGGRMDIVEHLATMGASLSPREWFGCPCGCVEGRYNPAENLLCIVWREGNVQAFECLLEHLCAPLHGCRLHGSDIISIVNDQDLEAERKKAAYALYDELYDELNAALTQSYSEASSEAQPKWLRLANALVDTYYPISKTSESRADENDDFFFEEDLDRFFKQIGFFRDVVVEQVAQQRRRHEERVLEQRLKRAAKREGQKKARSFRRKHPWTRKGLRVSSRCKAADAD